MTDQETLIRLLKWICGRQRSKRVMNGAAAALSVSLLAPVAFKLVDLFYPFKGTTVVVFFAAWTVCAAGLIVWWTRGRSGLAQAAAELDREADLRDEMKTAAWFIEHPRGSSWRGAGWIDAQIARAAGRARQIDPGALFPHTLPRKSLVAVSLALLLAVLNFLPLPLNHNWFMLEAAPAFSVPVPLTALAEEVKELLDKLTRPGEESPAARVDEILKALKEGRISLDQAVQELEALMDAIEELHSGSLSASELAGRLSEIAAKMGNAKLSESVENALGQREPSRAISELRAADESLLAAKKLDEVAKQLEQLERLAKMENPSAEALAERLDSLARDLESPRLSPEAERALAARDIPRVANALRQTAEQLSQGFANLSTQELQQIAQQLNELAQSAESQQAVAAASQGVENLARALAQSQAGQPGNQSAQNGQPGQQGSQPGQQGQSGQQQPGQGGQPGESGQPGQSGQAGQPGQSGQPGQPGSGPPGPGSPNGPPGGPGGSDGLAGRFQGNGGLVPRGAPTSLAVQLEKEALVAEHAETESTDLRSASQKERSKFAYRNAQSATGSARKDALESGRIPWESKEHVRNYFEAIHAPGQ